LTGPSAALGPGRVPGYARPVRFRWPAALPVHGLCTSGARAVHRARSGVS